MAREKIYTAANAEIHINYDEIPDFELEHMCRTVSAAVHRLLQDPKNKEDFERWRRQRKERTA